MSNSARRLGTDSRFVRVWKAVLDWINDHVQLRNSETPKLFYISTAQVLPLR
jgi:hypothetical protein